MNTKSIIIAAIFAVVAIVGARIVLDPPHGAAQADQANQANQVKTEAPDSGEAPDNDEMGQQFVVGDITIMKVQARETVPGASVGGGYMIITNNGSEDDKLLGGKTSVSSMLEMHEMKMDDDVMMMRQLNDGIVIKAGEVLTLKPGSLHIMFMGLEAPLAKDTSFKATLDFEKAGSVDVDFNVVDMKTLMKKHN